MVIKRRKDRNRRTHETIVMQILRPRVVNINQRNYFFKLRQVKTSELSVINDVLGKRAYTVNSLLRYFSLALIIGMYTCTSPGQTSHNALLVSPCRPNRTPKRKIEISELCSLREIQDNVRENVYPMQGVDT